MQPVVNLTSFPSLCDTITVELHNAAIPFAKAYSLKGTIGTNGSGNFIFPGGAVWNAYYIVVKGRNIIETWSKVTVTMNASTTFDFTAP